MTTIEILPITARRFRLKGRVGAGAIGAGVALFLTAGPASADFCLRLNGNGFSGDIGFFRFEGALPPVSNKMVPIAGRAAGTGEPVFGSIVPWADGNGFQIGATFFIDNTQGQFSLSVDSVTKTGSGHGNYGEYGTGGSSINVKVVGCAQEPGS